MPGGGVPAAEQHATHHFDQEGRIKRSGREGSLQRRPEMGQVRRRQKAQEDGEYPDSREVSVPAAQVPERPDDELRGHKEDAGVQGVPGTHIQGTSAGTSVSAR